MYLDNFFGIPVFESIHAVGRRQFRKPRGKRKRIQKKFAKNLNNFKTGPCAYMASGKYIVHPSLMDALRKSSAIRRA